MSDRTELEQRLALELHRFVAASGTAAHHYAATTGVNPSDLMALLQLWEAGLDGQLLTASQLAGRLNVTPAAVTYLVDRLAKKGYLERVTNPDDRRQVLLRVLGPGGQLSNDFVDPAGDWYARILTTRSDAELTTVTELLAELSAALTQLPSSPKPGGNQHD